MSGSEDASDAGEGPRRADAGNDAATVEAGTVVDGAAPLPQKRCDPKKPFGAPELVKELDPTAETAGSAIMTSDELEIFWSRRVGGVGELRHARRVDRAAPWTVEPMALSQAPEALLSLSLDGLRLYFSNLSQAPKYFSATRATNTSPFAAPIQLQTASLVGLSFSVANADDNVYYSRVGPANETRIVTTPIFSFGFADTPVVEVAGPHVAGAEDYSPILNTSQTNLYFVSERAGVPHFWASRRSSKAVAFAPPTQLTELDEPANDAITWVADDDCELLLNRSSHVYLVRRPL